MRTVCLFFLCAAVFWTSVPLHGAEVEGGGAGKNSSQSACSIEELKKLIVPAKSMAPPAPPTEVFNPNPTPDADPYHNLWNIWDGEYDTPTSITIRLMRRIGEANYRVAFLDRRNYVMSETLFDYPDNINVLHQQNRAVTASPGSSTHIFFCADQVQIPPGTSAYETEKLTAIGNTQRAWFFGEAVKSTGVDLTKIPEN